jgi:hypothetical protein
MTGKSSHEETNALLYPDRRHFYKVEKSEPNLGAQLLFI